MRLIPVVRIGSRRGKRWGCLKEGRGGNKKTKKTQKQCTNTYDEQEETHAIVGLFNRESVGEQECFKVAFGSWVMLLGAEDSFALGTLDRRVSEEERSVLDGT